VTESAIVETAWRVYDLLRTTAELLAALALVGGVVGAWTARRNATRRVRCRRLALGGVATLVVVLSLNYVYAAIVFVLTGTTERVAPMAVFVPAAVQSWPLLRPGGGLDTVVATVAPLCGVLGLAAIAIGSALWTVGRASSPTHRYGRQAVGWGIGALVVSVGGRLFAVAVYVLGPGL
jgi:uncharacterized membrane protein YsdA (DUF1294 family)